MCEDCCYKWEILKQFIKRKMNEVSLEDSVKFQSVLNLMYILENEKGEK